MATANGIVRVVKAAVTITAPFPSALAGADASVSDGHAHYCRARRRCGHARSTRDFYIEAPVADSPSDRADTRTMHPEGPFLALSSRRLPAPHCVSVMKGCSDRMSFLARLTPRYRVLVREKLPLRT